jgi:hypothetical protein
VTVDNPPGVDQPFALHDVPGQFLEDWLGLHLPAERHFRKNVLESVAGCRPVNLIQKSNRLIPGLI